MTPVLNDVVSDSITIWIGLVVFVSFVALVVGGIFALVRRIQINKAFKRQHSKNFQNYVEKLFFENKGFKYYCSPEKRFVYLTPYKKREAEIDKEDSEDDDDGKKNTVVYCFLSKKGKKYILYTDEVSGKLAYLDPKMDSGAYEECLEIVEGEDDYDEADDD